MAKRAQKPPKESRTPSERKDAPDFAHRSDAVPALQTWSLDWASWIPGVLGVVSNRLPSLNGNVGEGKYKSVIAEFQSWGCRMELEGQDLLRRLQESLGTFLASGGVVTETPPPPPPFKKPGSRDDAGGDS